MKYKVYTINELKDISEIDLPIDSDYKSSTDYLYLFNRFVRNKARSGTASTKTRSEVNVSGIKMYKQKGTGNARRGANSTPLRRGGGVIFGPKPRSYSFDLNKSFINNALNQLFTTVSSKINVVKSNTDTLKTSECKKFLSTFKNIKKVTLLIDENDINLIFGFRNIKNVHIDFFTNLDVEKIIQSDLVLISDNVAEHIKEKSDD